MITIVIPTISPRQTEPELVQLTVDGHIEPVIRMRWRAVWMGKCGYCVKGPEIGMSMFSMNHPIIHNPILGGTQFMFKISIQQIQHPILGVAQP